MIRIPSAGVGGLCVGIFSSWEGWLCVGVLCALPCAKNSVRSCRQSHRWLYVCRMFNRVTHNVSIYANIRYHFSCNNFLKFFFFSWLPKNTRLCASSANTTNYGLSFRSSNGLIIFSKSLLLVCKYRSVVLMLFWVPTMSSLRKCFGQRHGGNYKNYILKIWKRILS